MALPTIAQVLHNLPPSTFIKNSVVKADNKVKATVASRAQANKTVHNDVVSAMATGLQHALRASHATTFAGAAGAFATGRNTIATTARLPMVGNFVARTAVTSMMLADAVGEGVDYVTGQALQRATTAEGSKAWYLPAIVGKAAFSFFLEMPRLAFSAARLGATVGLGLSLSILYAAYAGVHKLVDTVRGSNIKEDAKAVAKDVKNEAEDVAEEIKQGAKELEKNIEEAPAPAADAPATKDSEAAEPEAAPAENAPKLGNPITLNPPKDANSLPKVDSDKDENNN